MTVRRGWAAGGAIAVSLAVHGAVLAGLSPPEGAARGATGTAEIAMLGTSFEDRAAGRIAPVAPPVEAVSATTPSTRVPPLPSTPVAGTLAPVAPVAVPASSSLAPAPEVPAVPALASVVPQETRTARDAPIARAPGDDTPRPQARPEPPRPSDPPPAAGTPPPDTGPDTRAARAGAPSGNAGGTASGATGAGGGGEAANPREIARYAQRVNRHLARMRRPNSSFPGSAVVSFTIAPGGGLAAISISQSSGDAAFDALALDHVRRAVPFPAPPVGAETRFAVAIRGR
ncbi:TonB family protein [Roseibacterium sp. SDUM158016]|uniref:TonB family protein n=1 Tax=Roseicyclus sediminis TaxID=2980997 RepID=UPI0021D1D220|nr:TonB family protein [Roseibacterium sp. SDUM158016]MCU4651381.1 TonB family protein [Roseibacterium sp. SDUM158016]